MTAEELLDKDYFHLVLDSRGTNISVGEIERAMREYAKIKCKDLLEIVVEKAEVKNSFYSSFTGLTEEVGKVFYTDNDGTFHVDNESILNVINLENFIE